MKLLNRNAAITTLLALECVDDNNKQTKKQNTHTHNIKLKDGEKHNMRKMITHLYTQLVRKLVVTKVLQVKKQNKKQ